MIDSSSTRASNRRERAFSLSILARFGSQNLRFIAVISVFLAAIFIASCGDEGDTPEDTTGMTDVLHPTTTPSETPPPPVEGLPPDEVVEEAGVSFQEDIQPIIASECAIAGCHAAPGAAGLDLSNYDTFKKGGNTAPGFIAGDGKGSNVVKRIDGGGMPLGKPPLDGDQIQLFIDWIDEGAENN